MAGEERKTITIKRGDILKKSFEIIQNDESVKKLQEGLPLISMAFSVFVLKVEDALFNESEVDNG